MTDFMYTAGAASIGFGKRMETINKEVLDYPAPGTYESRKNDKIVEPTIRQRERIKFTIPEEKKREARRKKDRVDTDPRMRRDTRPPVVTTSADGMNAQSNVKGQVVYTLGMSPRDKTKLNNAPGPGTHEIKSQLGDAPNYKMGPPSKEVKIERDQTGPGNYEVTAKSRAPKYSFGTRTTVSLGFGPKQQFKSMKPGPGAHDLKDVQFKKP
jgi:Sperm-tail PG-rich repeat